MKNNISKTQINNALNNVINESNDVNEGWFSNLFGDDYSKYSEDLQEIMENLVSNVYYDKDLITDVRKLYENVQKSDMDRRDKRELMDVMYNVYQTLEMSKTRLEGYIYRLQRLKK
jgi:hypothetical protein